MNSKRIKYIYRLNNLILIIFIVIVVSFLSWIAYKVSGFLDVIVVKDVVVEGASNHVTSRIHKELDNLKYNRIKEINLQAIDDKISKMPWVYNASVHRNFNGIITVKVIERIPYFIWLDDNNNYQVIGSDNKVINKKLNFSLERLISIEKGQDALDMADDIKFEIYKDKNILSHIKRIVFKKYRWDLELVNRTIIRLPINNIPEAYDKVVSVTNKYDLLNKNLEYIDATAVNYILVMPKESK